MTDQQFARAHDRYLTPPEQPEPEYEECGECGGCGVLTDEQGNEDKCHVCQGEGVVEVEVDEYDGPDTTDERDGLK